jgi:Plasmid encoded RepA protein
MRHFPNGSTSALAALDAQKTCDGIADRHCNGPQRNYIAEKQVGSLRFIDRVATIAESKDVFANGRTEGEWVLIARSLIDCPLPYKPSKERQITRRTRLRGNWVNVTYTCARPGLAMPYGADGRFMHWLIDKAVKDGRKAEERGEQPNRLVTWNSTYEYLRDIGASDGANNYQKTRERFRRLSGLVITIEYETAPEEHGKIIPFLESWHLPKTIDPKEVSAQKLLDIDRYGFTISDQLFKQAMTHLVVIPRPIWRLTKGSPRRGALLLWAFTRAYAANGPSVIPWGALHDQIWYDNSSPWKIKDVMKQVASHLHALWPEAKMRVTDAGVEFDRPRGRFLPDDAARGRVWRNGKE